MREKARVEKRPIITTSGVGRAAIHFILLLVLCTGPDAQAGSSLHTFIQAREPRVEGILGYKVDSTPDGTPRIAVLRESSASSPQILVRYLASGIANVEYVGATTDLRISWSHGALAFRSGTGEVGVVRIDPHRRAIIADDHSSAMFQKYKGPLIVVAAAVSDVTRELSLTGGLRSQLEEGGSTMTPEGIGGGPFQPSPDPGPTGGGTCSGSWVDGSGYNFRRSMACVNAQEDANNQCSNEFCWGCCGLLPCDCQCLSGDFYCECLASGQACGPTDAP